MARFVITVEVDADDDEWCDAEDVERHVKTLIDTGDFSVEKIEAKEVS